MAVIALPPPKIDVLAAIGPRITPAGQGRFVDMGDHRARVPVSSADTGGAFVLADMEANPKGGVPPHIHYREDETFYIQSGWFAIAVGGDSYEVGPGDTVFAPRYIRHSWQCISDTPGRALVLISPGANFEAFTLAREQMQIDPQDPASIARVLALTEQHDIRMMPSV